MPRRMIPEDYSKSNLYRKVTGRHFPFLGEGESRKDDGCSKITAFIRFLIK
jgi:hypothetical protein